MDIQTLKRETSHRLAVPCRNSSRIAATHPAARPTSSAALAGTTVVLLLNNFPICKPAACRCLPSRAAVSLGRPQTVGDGYRSRAMCAAMLGTSRPRYVALAHVRIHARSSGLDCSESLWALTDPSQR